MRVDGYTRKIVGWSMRDTLHTEITLDALKMALERQRPAIGLVPIRTEGFNTPLKPIAKCWLLQTSLHL